MNILITGSKRSEHSTFVTATCDRVSAYVCVYHGGLTGIRVCCLNASHRTYKLGAGKYFATLEDALNGYKSGEMKAIIQAAADECLQAA